MAISKPGLKALDLARRLEFDRARLSILVYLAFCEMKSLRYGECKKYCDKAIELAKLSNDARSLLSLRFMLYSTDGAGANEADLDEIDAVVNLAEKIRDRRLLSVAFHFRCRAHLLGGLFDRAQSDLERLDRLQITYTHTTHSAIRNKAWMDAEMGDYASVNLALEGIKWGRIGADMSFLPFLPRFARIADDTSTLDMGRDRASNIAKDDAYSVGMRWRALLFQGLASFLDENREAAERVYTEMRKIYDSPEFTYSHEERTIALTAETAGRFEEARSLFEHSLDSHVAKNARIEIPWDCYDLARWIHRYGEASDRDEAISLLSRGRAIAEEIGMKPVLARIDSLLSEIGIELYATGTTAESRELLPIDPTEGSRRFQDLTKRELEVLKLVANGLTNQEISRELFISEHTAANHVRHILSKLEVSNRIEAATLATRHGFFSADDRDPA